LTQLAGDFMGGPDALKRTIKALAFDQYGTIVDMQKGLTQAVTPFLRQKGWTGEPDRFVTWWRRTHFENSMIDALCDRGHTPHQPDLIVSDFSELADALT
jgi:2-haloacid dehalogenase